MAWQPLAECASDAYHDVVKTKPRNISVPVKLHQAMERHADVNWSAVACAAFEAELARRKKGAVMSKTIERLRQADEAELSEQTQDGKQAGRAWAERQATPKQLRRLDRFWETAAHDLWQWFHGNTNDAFSPGERLAEIISGEDMDRHARHDWWRDVVDGDPWTDADWVEGFCGGAMEVWGEVEDQI